VQIICHSAGSSTVFPCIYFVATHYPFLSVNRTSWQLEVGTLGLKAAGFSDLLAFHEQTVDGNLKGEDYMGRNF
jgi:hypothetical protein